MTAPGAAEVVKLARWPPFEMAPVPIGLLSGGFGIPASRAPSVCGDSAFAELGRTNRRPIKHGARMPSSLFMADSFYSSHRMAGGTSQIGYMQQSLAPSFGLLPLPRAIRTANGFYWFHCVRRVSFADE
jgi:hypothetical protein